jgi:uncharacterized membrane protein YgdD (TMEM256/DUF423 family)
MPRRLWYVLFHALGALLLVLIMMVEIIAFCMMARWYFQAGPLVFSGRPAGAAAALADARFAPRSG